MDGRILGKTGNQSMRALISFVAVSSVCSLAALAGPIEMPAPAVPMTATPTPVPVTMMTPSVAPTWSPTPAPTLTPSTPALPSAPAATAMPAPAIASPPPPPTAEACKTLKECGEEAAQCLLNKFVDNSDQSSGRRYFVQWDQNGVPYLFHTDLPSEEENHDAAECGGELNQCLARRCY